MPKLPYKKKVTLRMVAENAEVSRSTVLLALNPSSILISRKMRTHILRIAKEIGYKPTGRRQLENYYKSQE